MNLTIPHIGLCLSVDSMVGMGHLIRSHALLKNLNFKYSLSVFCKGEIPFGFFKNAEIYGVESWGGIEAFRSELKEINLAIVDLPFECNVNLKGRLSANSLIVVINDYKNEMDCDLLVRGVVGEINQLEISSSKGKEKLIGPKYSMIRKEFSHKRWVNDDQKILTIVIGSGDLAVSWLFYFLKIFQKKLDSKCVYIVVNNSFPEIVKLKRICAQKDIILLVGINAHEMHQLFLASTIALVTAGMVLYEAIAVGVPVVSLSLIDNMNAEATWFSKIGASVNVMSKNPDDAIDQVNILINNAYRREEISYAQSKILDGMGLDRITSKIHALLRGWF